MFLLLPAAPQLEEAKVPVKQLKHNPAKVQPVTPALQALLAAQPGAVNVASLGKIIPGWGQTEDFIAPWFATLEAKNK